MISCPCCKHEALYDTDFPVIYAEFGETKLDITGEWLFNDARCCPKCGIIFIPKE